jgi:Domain of unknown function (DUF4184)
VPFTPFHLGPGLLVKAFAPRYVSFTAFAATQVVIDVETLYHLVRHEWPVHRVMHTMLGGTAGGLETGLAVAATGPLLTRWASARLAAMTESQRLKLLSEVSLGGALVGGAIGGASHSILDSIVHSDVRPFWPFADSTLLGIIGSGSLHVGCLVAGVVGLAVLVAGRNRRETV